MKRRFKRPDKMTVFIVTVLVIWGLIIFYPFYNAVLISFMTQSEYMRNTFNLFPKSLNLDAYKYVFANSRTWTGYRATLIVVLLGVPLNMLLTTTLAYALSRKKYPGKKFFNFLVIFTMYFNGGVIPMYILVKEMKLTNTLWSMILVSGLNTFYMIIMKNFFMGIPDSLEEAARIDGANDLQIMTKVYIPVSKPIISTVLLFYLVDRWNEWYTGMLYLTDAEKWPLQLVIRDMVASTSMASTMNAAASELQQTFGMGVKMATIIVTMAPIMLAFPFLQKHFIQGMTAGAVKG